MRIERLRKEHGVRVTWVHFPLHPDTPQEGRSLEDLFARRGYDIPKMQAQMRARKYGKINPRLPARRFMEWPLSAMQPRRSVAQWRMCRIESRYWGKIPLTTRLDRGRLPGRRKPA